MKQHRWKVWATLAVVGALLTLGLSVLAAESDAPDTVPPTLTHQPVEYGQVGQPLEFLAVVTDETRIIEVRLHYRVTGQEEWTMLPMTEGACGAYTAQLDGALVTMDRLEYYIEASDGTNVTADAIRTVYLDQGIRVSSLSASAVSVSGAAETVLTVLGEGFTEDMHITVGGVDATFTLVSSTELALQLPALGLCRADLILTRGEDHCIRLQAITYEDPESYVRISAADKVYIGQRVGFPISIRGSVPVQAVSLQLQLNPAYFENIQFVLGTTNSDTVASFTISDDGLATLSVTSETPLSMVEPIGYLTADVRFVEKDTDSFLSIRQAAFHSVPVRYFDCPVTVSNQIDILVLNIPDRLYVVEGALPDCSRWAIEVSYDGVKSPLLLPVTEDMLVLSQDTPGAGVVRYFHKEYPFTYQLLEKELTRLVIKTPPDTLHYVLGQPLDLTGMTLELSYRDGELTVPVENYTVSGYDADMPGMQALTLHCSGLTETFQVAVFRKGDCNLDGKVTLLDMVMVKSHILEMSQLADLEALAADYNGDGRISILDYVQIKAEILGIAVNESE